MRKIPVFCTWVIVSHFVRLRNSRKWAIMEENAKEENDMPLDGITLSFVARELNGLLAGGRIDKVVQPERDEIILTVRNQGRNCQLLLSASADCARAHITCVKKNNPLEPPMLCMLMRKHIIGGRILSIAQAESDRILEIGIEHYDELGDKVQKRIVCEFMGRHSNIIFVGGDGRIIDSARRVTDLISSVREVLPGLRYERPPAHGKLPFDAVTEDALCAALSSQGGALHKAIAASVSGMSRQAAQELAFRATGSEDAHTGECDVSAAAASVSLELARILSGPAQPVVLRNPDGDAVDFAAFPYTSRPSLTAERFDTLSEAMDEFYRSRDSAERIRQKSAALHRVLKTNIERCEKKLALQQEALLGAAHMEEYRIKGELLTASLHLAQKGMKAVELPNYYEEGMPLMAVELDEKLSPGQNAQRYFKLYQKARSAQTLAAEQIEKTTEELDYLEGQMDNLGKCTAEPELAEIRAELEKFGYVKAVKSRRQMKQLPPSQPMKFTAPSGSIILVGKNNVQNDKLTFTADPMDWWLHVKDMPGSHVIIADPEADDETILYAARIAAKFSKGGSSSQVPVDYTRRKYVKKPGGAKPGFVIYTHQHTLYVMPAEVEAKEA